MQQEQEDHQRDDDQLFDERVPERLDACADERGAIVSRDDLDALGERGPELLDARLDRVDDLEGIRAGTSDDHSADDLAFSVEIRETPALRRADPHRADVSQDDGRAQVGAEDDLFQIARLFHVAASADIVLGAAHLQDAPAHVGVGHPHRVHDARQRDPERGEAIRV